MAIENGADVVEPIRIKGGDGAGEDNALFEREGIAHAEVRESAAVTRHVEVRLDSLARSM